MDSTRYHHFLWLPLLAYLLWFLERFAWFDGLSSIANDSVNYLVMARHYSPWVPETPANAIAWKYQYFPPLFPMFLAVSGSAHSLYWSHVLVTVVGLFALVPLYSIARMKGLSGLIALLVTAVFALSPGYLFSLQGILSESLYLLLSMVFLVMHGRNRQDILWLVLLGFILALLLLTRPVGFALWAALLIAVTVYYIKHKQSRRVGFLSLILSLFLFFIVMATLGPDANSPYGREVMQNFSSDQSLLNMLSTNIAGLIDAWRTFWLIYWHDGMPAQHYIVLGFGILALLALIMSLLRKPDDIVAWYVLIYLAVLVVWPHPGQMVRLVMPVVPLILILVIENVMAANLKARWKDYKRKVSGLLVLTMVVVTAPAHAFIHERIDYAAHHGSRALADYFRIISIDDAWQDLMIQQQMMDDFSSLDKYVGSDETLLYYVPAYPAVLSGIATEKLNTYHDVGRMKSEIILSRSDYLLLTYYHPRNKRNHVNGLIGDYFRNMTREVYCSNIRGMTISCLYEIIR